MSDIDSIDDLGFNGFEESFYETPSIWFGKEITKSGNIVQAGQSYTSIMLCALKGNESKENSRETGREGRGSFGGSVSGRAGQDGGGEITLQGQFTYESGGGSKFSGKMEGSSGMDSDGHPTGEIRAECSFSKPF